MHDNAIIIFIKNPEKGKVKTRLAKTVGDDKALDVYKKLLAHTRSVTLSLGATKYLYYANEVNTEDEWDNDIYSKHVQHQSDLGGRMLHAFSEVLERGHKKVLIIGSDCYQLNTEIINDAFSKLNEHDVVVGPTYDGGYYMIGMKKLIPELFENKEWSTETVYSDSIKTLEKLGHSYHDMPRLSDVDNEGDLPDEWR